MKILSVICAVVFAISFEAHAGSNSEKLQNEAKMTFNRPAKWSLLVRGSPEYFKHFAESMGVGENALHSDEVVRNLPQFVLIPSNKKERFEIAILVKDIPVRPDVNAESIAKAISSGYLTSAPQWMQNQKIEQEPRSTTIGANSAVNYRLAFDTRVGKQTIRMSLFDWVITKDSKLYIIGLSGQSGKGFELREKDFQSFLSSIKFL